MAELFAFGGLTEALAVTTTTGRVQLDESAAQAGKVVRIYNDGSAVVFVQPGGSTVTAVVPLTGDVTKGGMPIIPGRETGFTLQGGQTHLAFITASGTATVYVTQGFGI